MRDGLSAVDWLAQHTDKFSGSDLQELCAQSAQRVLSEFWSQQRHQRVQQASSASSTSTSTSTSAMSQETWQSGASDSLGRFLPAKLRNMMGLSHSRSVAQQQQQRPASGRESNGRNSGTAADVSGAVPPLRPLKLEDFVEVLKTHRPSTSKATEYHSETARASSSSSDSVGSDISPLLRLLSAQMAQMYAAPNQARPQDSQLRPSGSGGPASQGPVPNGECGSAAPNGRPADA